MLQYAAGEPVYSNNYSLTAGKRGAPSLTGAMRQLTRPLSGKLLN